MSKPMRCLIVDRDPEARSDLLAQLDVHAAIHVLAAVKTVAEAIPLLSLVPDVIFLDTSLAEPAGDDDAVEIHQAAGGLHQRFGGSRLPE